MALFDKLLIAFGLLALLLLASLRVFSPSFNPTEPVIWWLSFGWVLAVTLGIISHKGASISRSSPWRALGLITTLLVGMLTLYFVGLPTPDIDLIPLLFFGVAGCVVATGWWRLFHLDKEGYSKKQRARPIFGVVFVLLVTYIAYSKYFGR